MDLDSLRIETARLILRPTRAHDIDGWASLMADPEGAAAAMDWAFDVLCWDDVIHTIAPDNVATRRLHANSVPACVDWVSCRSHSGIRLSKSGPRRARKGAAVMAVRERWATLVRACQKC